VFVTASRQNALNKSSESTIVPTPSAELSAPDVPALDEDKWPFLELRFSKEDELTCMESGPSGSSTSALFSSHSGSTPAVDQGQEPHVPSKKNMKNKRNAVNRKVRARMFNPGTGLLTKEEVCAVR
jgi:hypothetical protein